MTDGSAQAGIPTVNTTTTNLSQHLECIGNMLIGLPGGRATAQVPGLARRAVRVLAGDCQEAGAVFVYCAL